MKRGVLNGLAISALLIATPLSTAYATPPVPMAVPDWSGFYVGLVGGYAWGTGKFTGTGTGAGQNNNVTMPGGTIGGRIGYDGVVDNRFVIGAVADLSWADLNGQTCVARFACDPSADAFATGKMTWLSTIRARAGAIYGDTLFYATGGLALAGLEGGITHLTRPSDPTLTASNTHTGWVVGVGVDYRLMRNVTVGVEYLYVALGNKHYDFSNSLPGAPIVLGADGTVTASIVRASLSYRFGASPL